MKKLAIIVFAVLLAGLTFYALKFMNFYKKIYTPIQETKLEKKAGPKTTFSVLLLGYGGANHEGAYLTDTMILVQIDTKKK